MTRTLRVRKLCLLLLAIAVAAAALAPGSASALRRTHHADPIKVFAKQKSPRTARAAGVASLFAADWGTCTASTVERPPVISSNAPQVKLVYAYPTDASADRFTSYKDLMQLDAKAVRDRIANESASAKTIRFDTGANCANPERYLDIQKVALDQNAAFYNGGSTFTQLRSELKTKLAAPADGARVNYVVYADLIQSAGASGEADLPQDDSKSLLNAMNQGQSGDGRLFAFVYGHPVDGTHPNGGLPDFNGGFGAGPRQATFLHELTHNLGAVQTSAPHTSQAGHCLDERDIMCYDDDGPGSPTVICNTGTPFDFTELYDCNRDDYFNPSPAANTYLAQRWNTYDSVYLCNLADCDSSLTPPSGATVSKTHTNGALGLAGGVTSGQVAHYEWDTDGDGIYDTDTGTTPSITPAWDSPGARTAHMRASQADGTYAVASVLVDPVTPTPHFQLSGKFVAGQTLTLDGTSTEDPDGLITKFLWDLDGDEVYETNTGLTRTATTSFAAPGQVSVGLEVDYPFGISWSRTAPFTIVRGPAPGTGGTTPLPGTTPGPTTTVAGPVVGVLKVKLGKLLTSGLPLTVTCGAQCTVTFSLSVDAKMGKKLGLKGPKGRPIVLGRLTGIYSVGTTKPKLTLTAKVKRILKRAKKMKATVTGKVTQGPLSPLKISKPITFTR